MIDPERGWSTPRLVLEPLVEAHAMELAAVLDDPALHEFIGGSPLTAAAQAERYARLESRHSPDGTQTWCNWVLRLRETGVAVGTVQATLPAGGPDSGPAQVAWVIASFAQGRGYATEAAVSLVRQLHDAGWGVVAHVHTDHTASQRVARAAGLSPTDQLVDGEIRWQAPAPTPAPGTAARHRPLKAGHD